jgi:endonuclease/exonuclease/phosphatase (EEP) superfamily protein YafD
MTRSLLLPLALLLLTAAVASALAIGFLGRIHAAFDSFSHFRLHLAVLLAILGVVLLATQFRREGVFALVFALAAFAVTPGTSINGLFAADAQADADDDSAPVYRLLQFNGRFDNRTPEAFLSLVGRTRPDVITMQEVSAMWRERLAPLKTAYPHQIICQARGAVGGVAILSRRPFLEGTEPGCLDGGTFALATLGLGGEPVQVAAVHLYWPWPYEQPTQITRLHEALAGLSPSAIMAGDFNAVRWSHSVRSMAAAASMRDAGPVGPSWLSYRLPSELRSWIGLGIDHVLVGRQIVSRRVERLDYAGSDHLPVMLEFSVKQTEVAPARQTDVVDGQIAPSPIS